MKKAVAEMSEAELLALAMREPRPRAPSAGTALDLVRAFLRDTEIAPGRTPGVEVCTLYRYYRAWLAAMPAPPAELRPQQFSRSLRELGFRRAARSTRGGVDRRALCLSKDSASRLLEWREANPDAPDDRKLFEPPVSRGASP